VVKKKSSYSAPLKLYLIRHGETEWSITGQHTGRTDLALTAAGEDEVRQLSPRLSGATFSHLLTSPLKRAQRTCALVGLNGNPEIEPDLIEWNYGDYDGLTTEEIREQRPDWNVFCDGCPNGELPAEVASRADRLITHLRQLEGNVALFTHGHFGRVLAARWIGLPITEGEHFQLDTGSLSILGIDADHADAPMIELWNATPPQAAESEGITSIERWENEGGEISRKQ
jgi:probable phosphoglycerate mutase